jgi:hypothetical protein
MLLKPLEPNAKTITIPVQDLDHVSPSVTEHKQISRERVLTHDLLDHNGKTIDGFSHIGAAHSYEDPVRLRGKHHIAATSRINCGRDDTGASVSSSIVKPFGVMIRITGELSDFPFIDGSFKGTRVRPVSVSRQRRRQ